MSSEPSQTSEEIQPSPPTLRVYIGPYPDYFFGLSDDVKSHEQLLSLDVFTGTFGGDNIFKGKCWQVEHALVISASASSGQPLIGDAVLQRSFETAHYLATQLSVCFTGETYEELVAMPEFQEALRGLPKPSHFRANDHENETSYPFQVAEQLGIATAEGNTDREFVYSACFEFTPMESGNEYCVTLGLPLQEGEFYRVSLDISFEQGIPDAPSKFLDLVREALLTMSYG